MSDATPTNESLTGSRRFSRLLMLWLPPPAWMAMIFALSSQSSFGQHSWLTGIPGYDKMVHGAIYAVLAVLLYRLIASDTRLNPVSAAFLAVAGAVLFGLTDELHQAFVPRRQPSMWDLLADAVGAGLGTAALLTLQRSTEHLRTRRSRTKSAREGRSSLARAFAYMRPQRWRVAIAMLCLLLGAGCQLAIPAVVMLVVDDGFVGSPGRAHGFVMLFLGVLAVDCILGGVRSRLLQTAGQYLTLRIRKDAYDAVQDLPLAYFEDTNTGDIMSRLTSDVDQIEALLVRASAEIISSSVRLVGVACIMIWLDWRIALAAVLPAPLIALGVATFGRRIRKLYRGIRDQLGILNGRLQESLSGIHVIKSFASEARESAGFAERSDDYARQSIHLINLSTVFYPAIQFAAGLGFVCVLYAGIGLIQEGSMTPGELVAALGWLLLFYGPVYSLSRINEVVQRALAASDRVFEVMSDGRQIADADDAVALETVTGRVEFRDVHFTYETGDEVLRGISIIAEPGQCIALIGRSGAGKSSIINLIPRLYEATGGQVLVDGLDVRDVGIKSLRRSVATVLQDTFLFSGTVRENIAYARPDASIADVRASAESANAHGFISELPEGYETLIGERGVKLSGGQKQRVSIARAILADPRILILDEATSSVDSESEALIHEALGRLIAGRTTFIIAHRLSTVVSADKIVVLERGEVVEQGTHTELMGLGGLYASMCQTQLALGDLGVGPTVPRSGSGVH